MTQLNIDELVEYDKHPAFKQFISKDDDTLSPVIRDITERIEEKGRDIMELKLKGNNTDIESLFKENLEPLFAELEMEYITKFTGNDLLKKAFSNAIVLAKNDKINEIKYGVNKFNFEKSDLKGKALISFEELEKDGVSSYKIPEDDILTINKSLKEFIAELKKMSLSSPTIRNVIRIPKRGRHWDILLKHFRESGFLEASSNSFGEKLDIKGLGLEHSTAEQTWWKSCYEDFKMDTADTTYMHLDYDFGSVKAMVYLSEVTDFTGPFSYIKGSHKWVKSNTTLDYIIKALEVIEYPKIAPVNVFDKSYYRKMFNSVEGRTMFCSQPKILRRLSHFGDDLTREMTSFDHLLGNETKFTSNDANFIFFTGAYGIHRGGTVKKGERIAIQILLGPKFSKGQKATQWARRTLGEILSYTLGDKFLIKVQKITNQVL